MKRVGSFLPFVISMLLLSPTTAETQKKVLIIAREISRDMDFTIKNEVTPMIYLLTKAGYQVLVATESGGTISSRNAQLVPDLKLSEVRIADYEGVLIPCMQAREDASSVPDVAIPIMKDAYTAGKPIAAQCALEMIEAAGLLTVGRRVAREPGVVVDGKLLTSYNCPYMASSNYRSDDTPMLITKFIEVLNSP